MFVLIAVLLDLVDSLLVERDELLDAGLQSLHVVADLLLCHLLNNIKVCAVGDIAYGSDNLQLCCSLIDREDTGVAVQALTLVFHDETRASVNGDGVIGILIGIL